VYKITPPSRAVLYGEPEVPGRITVQQTTILVHGARWEY